MEEIAFSSKDAFGETNEGGCGEDNIDTEDGSGEYGLNYGFKFAPVALVLAWFLNCAHSCILLLSPKLFLGSKIHQLH